MAVSITNPHYDLKLNPDFIKWFSNELNYCFAAFKRIDRIYVWKYNSNKLTSNLQQADREFIRSEIMWI